MQPRLYYCDCYAIPLPPGHKFPMEKYRLVRDGLTGVYAFECAPFAPPDTVMLVHERDYVERFLRGTLPPQVVRRIGFPWSEGLVRRTMASVGGTLMAAEDALDCGLGGNVAGGTHHAFRGEGSGFCVFNDIAVAILALRERGWVRRAAVVDLDVHQGDGTAQIFRDDPDVLTLSLHGRNNFPFRKQESVIDVALPDGTTDEQYLEALREVLPRVFAFAPDIVFYQSGVDGLASDRLGKLALTAEGLLARDRLVMEAVYQRRLPFVLTLGGGYSEPIALTVAAHVNTYRLAAEIFR